MFVQSALLRHVLLTGYRTMASGVLWLPEPRVMVSSLPKSGTHLAIKILEALPRMMFSATHLDNSIVGEDTSDIHVATQMVNLEKLARALAPVRKGQIASSHLHWQPGLATAMRSLGFRQIYVMRDPRDVVVSSYYYIKNLRRHPLHQLLHSMDGEERQLMAFIEGASGYGQEIPSIGTLLRRADGWRDEADVLLVRFEELIGARGDGNADLQRQTIARMAAWVNRPLSDAALDRLIQKLSGTGSATFRKGKIGEWEKHFTPAHRQAFEAVAGDYMQPFGYSL